jgi:hypothetical protein
LIQKYTEMATVASAAVAGNLFFYRNGLSYGWKGQTHQLKMVVLL